MPQHVPRAKRLPETKSQCGFLPNSRWRNPAPKMPLSIPGKSPLQAKVEKPPLLSISRVGVMAEPDREARPSGSAEASDPARLEDTAVVQNRIAMRIGSDGWVVARQPACRRA